MNPFKLLTGAAILLVLACLSVRAAETTASTEPTFEPGSPKEALKKYGDALPAGGLDAAETAYFAVNDQEKRVARAMSAVDMATAKLQELTRQKFGSSGEDAVLHAARNATLTDLADADESIDGNTAVVTFKGKLGPVTMIKVNGQWKVSIGELLKANEVRPDDLISECAQIVGGLDATTKELKDGELPNIELLTRAVKQRMYHVLGEE
jgi:hypothetical protein